MGYDAATLSRLAARLIARRDQRSAYVWQGVAQPVPPMQQPVAEKQIDPAGIPLATQSAFDAHDGPKSLQDAVS